MRHLLITVLVFVLAGCSTVTYYAPESESNASRGGNACATLVAYQATLAGTIRLFAYAQPRQGGVNLTVSFRVPNGESIQLLSPEFIIRQDFGAPVILNVANITSGSNALRIPVVKFEPTALLLGAGRYGQLEPPYGPDDAFVADLTFAAAAPPSRLDVQLPSMRINGRAVTASPLSFVLRSESRALCVQ